MDDDLNFLVDDEVAKAKPTEFYKLLVIDDEESIHLITKAALQNRTFDGKGLDILTAMSAKEAKELLEIHKDIPLALVDVVMETPSAGLELVDYIRNDLKNDKIRLVLRTGQANNAPEEQVIDRYDINDYKEKTELTVEKLYTLVRTSIKQYEQLRALEDSRDEIYRKMTTSELLDIPNRMKLNEMLDSKGKKSLIVININDFSSVNEQYGFDVGDKLLIEFSRYLNSISMKNMTLFHLYGDVFSLMCLDLDEKEVTICLEKFKDKINAQQFIIEGREIGIKVSIGLALHEVGNLIQKAELAMKKSTKCENNTIKIYSDKVE